MPGVMSASRRRTRSPEDDAELMRALADAGLRRTSARARVLGLLRSLDAPASHAELETDLDDRVDRVTLYRVLDSLVEAGLAHRTVAADRVTRYASAGRRGTADDHGAHGHFHCTDCGRVYCVEVPPPARGLPRGFVVESASLNYTGRCATCRRTAD